MVFLVRGGLAAAFGVFALFFGATNLDVTIAIISILLLFMGIIDAVSTKAHRFNEDFFNHRLFQVSRKCESFY